MIRLRTLLFSLLLASPFTAALADDYDDTIKLFRSAEQDANLLDSSYGYAVFPTIGKAGVVLGAAHGTGRVYINGQHVGDTTMNQLSVGPQLGGQAYSQIIFFENKRAFDKFASGHFELGATASAVAITAAATAQATTGGAGVGASGTPKHATTASHYNDGIAIFTITKGGLMHEASVGGQKFSYRPK
ncbi:MAG TPA: lipid-binding SYLF domain-containing protein [Burkholderiales bacterium]|nr:lipid-binding SYLF domain-containing protein [Burkholderiales bacterium]